MNKKKSASAGIMSFCGEYSYILVFIAIFIVYAFTSSGLTWSGVMNVFRHSAVVSLKMDSLINNAIKGMILLIVIMIQVAGPKIRGKLK